VTQEHVTVESLPAHVPRRSGDGVAGSWSGAGCIDRALFPRGPVVARAFPNLIGQQHSGKSPSAMARVAQTRTTSDVSAAP
jgi:hypothetical protein